MSVNFCHDNGKGSHVETRNQCISGNIIEDLLWNDGVRFDGAR